VVPEDAGATLKVKERNAMCGSCEVRIDDVWLRLHRGQVYRTPDYRQGVMFTIDEIAKDSITIATQNVKVSRHSFVDVLHYLRENHHHHLNPCEVRSNDDPQLAGPLCRAARARNNNSRCINYILPILQNHGLVGIDCDQPNKTWIVTRWSE
jgi:hypothetical protein